MPVEQAPVLADGFAAAAAAAAGVNDVQISTPALNRPTAGPGMLDLQLIPPGVLLLLVLVVTLRPRSSCQALKLA
jgi:hypothetical protein